MNTTTSPQVEHIDPASIQIEDNVREAVEVPSEFVASIKQHGVLQPVLATRDSEGVVRVRDGQRRTLAAREAGVTTIPAYIVSADAETKTRLVQQIVANEQRDGLTARDKARGFHALALEGMSVAAIAKATGTKRQQVQTHVSVATSESASAALDQGVTLEAAAAIAEFEGDEEAQSEILTALERGQQAEWVAEHIRERKQRDATIEEAAAPLREAGVRILDDDERYSATSVDRLADKAAEPDEQGYRPALDEDAHQQCPGHAVYVGVSYGGDAQVRAYCTSPAEHVDRYGAPAKQSGPMTDEQKAERKQLIANNKAWDAAEAVRRAWLAEFLARKTLPKDATAYAATTLAATASRIGQDETRLAADLLGQEQAQPFYSSLSPVEGKPAHTLTALALASVEAGTGRHTWRGARAGSTEAAYFRQIAAWGYPLSEVEQIATVDSE